MMGGQLLVESIYGTGSEFYFSIPLERCALPKDRSQAQIDESTCAAWHQSLAELKITKSTDLWQ